MKDEPYHVTLLPGPFSTTREMMSQVPKTVAFVDDVKFLLICQENHRNSYKNPKYVISTRVF